MLPTLQASSLSTLYSHSAIFHVSSIYSNMDYYFLTRKQYLRSKTGKNPYPYIILYFYKIRNDKLVRNIDINLLELIRYAERECQNWFAANESKDS